MAVQLTLKSKNNKSDYSPLMEDFLNVEVDNSSRWRGIPAHENSSRRCRNHGKY
jgi:hypothetical protein